MFPAGNILSKVWHGEDAPTPRTMFPAGNIRSKAWPKTWHGEDAGTHPTMFPAGNIGAARPVWIPVAGPRHAMFPAGNIRHGPGGRPRVPARTGGRAA